MTTARQHIVTAEAEILCAEKPTIITDTMQGLLDHIEQLKKALLSSPCPYPVDGKNTVLNCINARNCGCDNQAAIEGVRDHRSVSREPEK